MTDLVCCGEENSFTYYLSASGEETERGIAKNDIAWGDNRNGNVLLEAPPRLIARPATFIADVFANTSWRKKRCDFEVEVDWGNVELWKYNNGKQHKLVVSVFDESSNLVWRGEKKIAIGNRIGKFVVPMPWDEKIVSWELGRPALYTAQVSLCGSAALCDGTTVRFGFREVWREGRHLYMNGHPLHLRPSYYFCANRNGAKFARDTYGFNTLMCPHEFDSAAFSPRKVKFLDMLDGLGMGAIISCGSGPQIVGGMKLEDDAARQRYREFVREFHRQTRNHPSLLVCYVSSMIICDIGSQNPLQLGRAERGVERDLFIDAMREENRAWNPNVLYFSHADGSNGDIASSNLYLNWTPLQEQEEWLSHWTSHGSYPWFSVEHLAPYGGDFSRGSLFLPTEFFAAIFGDRAYAEERLEDLKATHEIVADPKFSYHNPGGDRVRGYTLYGELRRKWAWRQNSRWRAFGLNGGLFWFNMKDIGMPPDKGHHTRFVLDEPAKGCPEWAEEAREIFSPGNLDFCGFIGGAPEFADNTHAYYSGEKVEKHLVFIWDGVGEKKIDVEWQCSRIQNSHKTSLNTNVAKNLDLQFESNCSVSVPQGGRAFFPVSFTAPEVAGNMRFRIEATFTGDGIEPFVDTFDFEVWPKNSPGRKGHDDVQGLRASADSAPPHGKAVALMDNGSGEGTAILKALGVPFRPVSRWNEIGSGDTHLVVAKNVLDKMPFPKDVADRVGAGMHVLVLPQSPNAWLALGFKVEDLMLREVFPRDRTLFGEFDEGDFALWRGAPAYGDKPYGAVMAHQGQRGPRWTRRHVVAGLLLKTPDKPGFLPQVVGGCDLAYSALLKMSHGAGSVRFCTLDFEGRIGVDPAATAVARTVFSDFLLSGRRSATPVGFVEADEKDGWAWGDVESAARGGTNVLVRHSPGIARAAGFGLAPNETIYRAPLPDAALFHCVGPGDLRWPDGLAAERIVSAPPEFKILAAGLVAESRVGRGTVVFCQIPPHAFEGRYDGETSSRAAALRRLAAVDQETVDRFHSRLATNLGAGAGPLEARRALHTSASATRMPLPDFHVLGPFRSSVDNSRTMLDTVWSEEGEKMAVAGDFNPNVEFPLPQGGTANWRPVLNADPATGCFDFGRLGESPLTVNYAICEVSREKAGPAVLHLGFDWRCRVWCNGEEVFRRETGCNDGAKFDVALDLKQGVNSLAFKVGGGINGCRIWALLDTERADAVGAPDDAEVEAASLYSNKAIGLDPYAFAYW